MGSLARFHLRRIREIFDTPNFFETGTFLGEGVSCAVQVPFDRIISVEIIKEIADKARLRFEHEEKVEIIHADSISAMESQLPLLSGNTVFWLDAHYPGADAGIADYENTDNETLRLPLYYELGLIQKHRTKCQDVLILDDLRIYEDGPFQNGPVPPDALPRGRRDSNFIYQTFGDSHYIFKCYLDEGYIILLPKDRYDQKNLRWTDLLTESKLPGL